MRLCRLRICPKCNKVYCGEVCPRCGYEGKVSSDE